MSYNRKIKHSKIKYSKRKQQVRRQLYIAGAAFAAVFVLLCTIKISARRSEAKEAVKIEKQKSSEKQARKETGKEHLARVKKEAREAGYPDGVIELLSKNSETVNFVEDYGEKKDVPAVKKIDELEPGKIPQLLQWDERWGYADYGTSIVAVSGCGPTCMSMVVAGLTGDNTVTPAKVAAYGTENHFVDEENNTYWEFMRRAGQNWGVSCREGDLSEELVSEELQKGHPIICSVGPGDFTQNGHFIVLTSYKDGKVTVNDPFSQKNSEKEWVYQDIVGQMKAMWIYSAN